MNPLITDLQTTEMTQSENEIRLGLQEFKNKLDLENQNINEQIEKLRNNDSKFNQHI